MKMKDIIKKLTHILIGVLYIRKIVTKYDLKVLKSSLDLLHIEILW